MRHLSKTVGTFLASSLLLASLSTGSLAEEQDFSRNLLSSDRGAKIVRYTSSYRGEGMNVKTLNYSDHEAVMSTTIWYAWVTKTSAPFPHEVVFDLGQERELSFLDFHTEDFAQHANSRPGIAPKKVKIYLGDSPRKFSKKKMISATLDKKRGGRVSFKKRKSESFPKARYLKISIESNHGNPHWTYSNFTLHGPEPLDQDPYERFEQEES